MGVVAVDGEGRQTHAAVSAAGTWNPNVWFYAVAVCVVCSETTSRQSTTSQYAQYHHLSSVLFPNFVLSILSSFSVQSIHLLDVLPFDLLPLICN